MTLESLQEITEFANKTAIRPANSLHLSFTMVDSLSEKEFVERIGWSDVLGITYSKGKFVSFVKEVKEVKENADPPILMTEKIFNELKAAYPSYSGFNKQIVKIKDYTGIIYGEDVIWTNHKDLKL